MVIAACVVCNRISSKLGVPMLLAFILLGMFFGSDGVVKIDFSNYMLTEQVCSVALIFIMFYGGFGTKWSEAKPVFVKSLVLSSVGTVVTCGLVGLFCWKALGIALLESFLIGAVISSTDAASVFSILRSKRLNLKDGTASLLEVESGSNDPFSYMLTVIFLSMMNGDVSGGGFVFLLFKQVMFGVACGVAIAVAALAFMKRFRFGSPGFDAIFIVAVALFAYAVPTCFGGNGYLSAYLTGIILGNRRIGNKKALVHFFDGLTGLMQMLLFFLLGLLAFPSQMAAIVPRALAIALFLTFVARPIAVFAILGPFKSKLGQMLLVSWAGMRGAASIVFAIMTVIDPAVTHNDIFHIVFFIVLFSILLQGTLLPLAAQKLDMTDADADVMKTFNDYTDEVPVRFLQFTVEPAHPWVGQTVSEITLPPDSILALVLRDHENIVPNGKTEIRAGDVLVLSGKAGDKVGGVRLYERTIGRHDPWVHRKIAELPASEALIVMIRRAGDVVIPSGDTILQERDVLVVNDAKNMDE